MQVTKLRSYAMFGTKQFPVNISLMQSDELIQLFKDNGATTYNRSYTSIHETSPDAIVKHNFDGLDLWKCVRACDKYVALLHDDPTTDLQTAFDFAERWGLSYQQLLLDSSYTPQYANHSIMSATSITALSGDPYDTSPVHHEAVIGGYEFQSGTPIVKEMGVGVFCRDIMQAINMLPDYAYDDFLMDISFIPSDYILNGVVNQKYIDTPSQSIARVRITGRTSNDLTEITKIEFDCSLVSIESINSYFANVNFPDAAQDIDDTDNPYGDPGTSGPGGGDGGYGDPDEVDPTAVPDLPTISASSTGFITIYNPTSANLSSLGSFLWSNLFDINTFKKLYTDPMDCIISLGIVPCVPNSAGTRNIYFGNVDTGINCSYLSTQYAKVDCGSVNITKYVGSFMDYSPYVKVSLFLPYIGFIHLGTDDIMGGSINVTYHVDVLSGDCIAFITHSSKGVLYSYTGNCLTNVPVTAANYANSLRNYYEAVSGIIPSTVNGAMSGGAAGAAAGAISGTLSAASNIVLNTKPDFQRSGSLGGSSGIMGVQKPFIIIERPNISVPNKVQHYMGQTSNMTASLGGLSGMTIVEAVHLEGIPCTTSELAEIESILHQGVIL